MSVHQQGADRQPAILSFRAAARLLKISRRQVEGAVVGGPLIPIKLGDRQYVTTKSVLAFERYLCREPDAVC